MSVPSLAFALTLEAFVIFSAHHPITGVSEWLHGALLLTAWHSFVDGMFEVGITLLRKLRLLEKRFSQLPVSCNNSASKGKQYK